MRLMLDCAIATTLPRIIDSNDRISSMPCQSNAVADNEPTRRRIMNANAASLGAAPMNRVTGVGAPSYTSGIHM